MCRHGPPLGTISLPGVILTCALPILILFGLHLVRNGASDLKIGEQGDPLRSFKVHSRASKMSSATQQDLGGIRLKDHHVALHFGDGDTGFFTEAPTGEGGGRSSLRPNTSLMITILFHPSGHPSLQESTPCRGGEGRKEGWCLRSSTATPPGQSWRGDTLSWEDATVGKGQGQIRPPRPARGITLQHPDGRLCNTYQTSFYKPNLQKCLHIHNSLLRRFKLRSVFSKTRGRYMPQKYSTTKMEGRAVVGEPIPGCTPFSCVFHSFPSRSEKPTLVGELM